MIGTSRHPRIKNHLPSMMHWSLPTCARTSRSSLFMLAYISGKSAAKLSGIPAWDSPQVEHFQPWLASPAFFESVFIGLTTKDTKEAQRLNLRPDLVKTFL